mmetsp:Transcript_41905/g.78391  ORF Transcript_41905/g.78391 Transcript_41905/m.78391 type:complete len:178 (-) Transcript_41905:410-943(-)
MSSSKVYVGNLDSRVTERELEDEFMKFGTLRSVWVARKPPGFAFIEFQDPRDADDACRDVDGRHGWRVELSRSGGPCQKGGNGPRYGGGPAAGGNDGGEMKCYECGDVGHFARDCRARSGGMGGGGGGYGGGGGGYYGGGGRSPPRGGRASPRYSPPRGGRSRSPYRGGSRGRSRSR